jgi:hypothetical protein
MAPGQEAGYATVFATGWDVANAESVNAKAAILVKREIDLVMRLSIQR